MREASLENHPVVSREEWLAERKRLLLREKELTRARDELAAERRELPWVRLDKSYHFQTESGPASLVQLFRGHSQLIVRHFMFAPDWEAGCIGCSFSSDHVDGALTHLHNRDVNYVAISRAPAETIQAFKRRMSWRFEWASSLGTDFNYDFNVSFTPESIKQGSVYYNYERRQNDCEDLSGLSVFYRNRQDEVFHTYSCFARGDELMDTTYQYLDISPKGRNETGPNRDLSDWVKHHDRY